MKALTDLVESICHLWQKLIFFLTLVPCAIQDNPTTKIYMLFVDLMNLVVQTADPRLVQNAMNDSLYALFAAYSKLMRNSYELCSVLYVTSLLMYWNYYGIATAGCSAWHCGKKLVKSSLWSVSYSTVLSAVCLYEKGSPTCTPAYRGFVTRLDCEWI